MKGIDPLLSHGILLLLGLVAMSLLIVSVSISLSTTEKNLISLELNFVAESVKNKIIEVYSLANQSSNYTTGLFELNLPEKIGNKRYSVTLSQNNLLVNTSFGNQPINVAISLPIDAELSGSQNMPFFIKVDKSNGQIKIGLVK